MCEASFFSEIIAVLIAYIIEQDYKLRGDVLTVGKTKCRQNGGKEKTN